MLEPASLTIDQRTAALEKFPVLKGLGAPALRGLAEQMTEERHPKGHVLLRPGDALERVWFILTGWVDIRMAGVSVAYFAAGEPSGDVGAFSEHVSPVLNIVGEPVTALSMRVEDFLVAVERTPKLAQNFMRYYGAHLRILNLARLLHFVPQAPAAPAPTEGDRAAILRALPLFAGVEDQAFLRRLAANVKEATFSPGEEICRRGAPNDTMFLLVSGEAEARLDDVAVGTLTPGHSFGELGLLDGEPHPASLIALSACRCLTLGRAQLFAAVNQSPRMSLNLLRVLAWRCRLSALDLARGLAATEDAAPPVTTSERSNARLPYLDVPEEAWVQDPHRRWRMPLSGDLTRQFGEVEEVAAAVDAAERAPDAEDFRRALREEQAALARALRELGCPEGTVALAADIYPLLRSTVHPKRGAQRVASALADAALGGGPLRLRAVLASPTAVAEAPSFLRFADVFRRRGLAVDLRALLVRWENLAEVEGVAEDARDEAFQGVVAKVREAFAAQGFPAAAVEPVPVSAAIESGVVTGPADVAAAFDEVARARADLSRAAPTLARDLLWITGFYDRQTSLRQLGARQPPLDLTLRRYIGGRFSAEASELGSGDRPALLMLTSELHKRFLTCYAAAVPMLNIALDQA